MESVFAVPRAWKCTSAAYIHIMNLFGNLGGFDAILTLLKTAKMSDEPDKDDPYPLDVSMMGILA